MHEENPLKTKYIFKAIIYCIKGHFEATHTQFSLMHVSTDGWETHDFLIKFKNSRHRGRYLNFIRSTLPLVMRVISREEMVLEVDGSSPLHQYKLLLLKAVYPNNLRF